MAMTLSNIASSLLSRDLSTQTSTSKTATDVTQAFKAGSERVAQKLESTKVQLSSYGQIKSAFADVQSTSKVLTDTKSTATSSDAKKAVQSFVDAYNKANSAVSSATQSGGKTGALANDSRAKVAGNDLRSAVSQGSTASNLREIGITQNKDGSLSVDSKKLDQALQSNASKVQSTLSSVGSKVAQTASSELADKGNIGGSVTNLSKRSASLEAEQSKQQALAAASQQAVAQSNQTFSQSTGVAAYQKLYTT